MRCFKEEKIQEYFNDAVIVTTRKHFYYMSAEEKRMHKIKMASQGFEDSGQNVKNDKRFFCGTYRIHAGFLCILWRLYKTGNS